MTSPPGPTSKRLLSAATVIDVEKQLILRAPRKKRRKRRCRDQVHAFTLRGLSRQSPFSRKKKKTLQLLQLRVVYKVHYDFVSGGCSLSIKPFPVSAIRMKTCTREDFFGWTFIQMIFVCSRCKVGFWCFCFGTFIFSLLL